MKTTNNKYKYVLVLILMMTAAQQLKAQDAFYIYRNDGDFNGFFYDEVKRMGYSKFDLDSIEHDIYVVQEVETADSLYRIPLASIDSIGFQQPEVKFNPKFKPVAKAGLLPYLKSARDGWVRFLNLPSNLKPSVGDILVGFPTDENASRLYDEGSFSCVVDRIDEGPSTLQESGTMLTLWGHAIDQFSDVFEQYITVEELGYDQQGNLVRHRVAGIDANGGPRREYGEGSVNLIDFSGTLTREWNPNENTSVSFNADVGVKFRVKVAYNIGWHFFVKLTKDLIVDVQPSFAMASTRGFEFTLGTLNLPLKIWFPTQCPIFELEPYPDVFVRGGGKLEAKLNFPKSRIAFGDDIVIDSEYPLFPMRYSMHWVPEETKPGDNLIDIGSTNISLSGFLQTGIKFHAGITTASWYKKLFKGDIGLDLYVGPKLDAALEFKTDWLNNEGFDLYDQLYKSSINATWLSCDLEAKATASVLWKTPMQKTFYSKNFPFFCDTIRLVPDLRDVSVIVGDNNVRAILRTKNEHVLGYTRITPIIKSEYSGKEWSLDEWSYSRDTKEYTSTIPLSEFKAGDHLLLFEVNKAGHKMRAYGREFRVPRIVEIGQKELKFNSSGDQVLKVPIKTNAIKEDIRVDVDYQGKSFEEFLKKNFNDFLDVSVNVIDEDAGLFELIVKVKRNLAFTRKCQIQVLGELIDVTQEKGDLKGVKTAVKVNFDGYGTAPYYTKDYDVSLSWIDDNSFIVEGTHTEAQTSENNAHEDVVTNHNLDIRFTISKEKLEELADQNYQTLLISDGVYNYFKHVDWEKDFSDSPFSNQRQWGTLYNRTSERINATFDHVGHAGSDAYKLRFYGGLNSGQVDCNWQVKDATWFNGRDTAVRDEEFHYQIDTSKNNYVELYLFFPKPDE